MASSSSEDEVDVMGSTAEMGVEITSTVDLVKAINAGQSYLPIVRGGSDEKGWGPQKFRPL